MLRIPTGMRPLFASARDTSHCPISSGRIAHLGFKDCDRADGTPPACLVEWRGAPGRCTAGVARYDIVRWVRHSRMGIVGTMSNPARPGERQRSAGSGSGSDGLSLSQSQSETRRPRAPSQHRFETARPVEAMSANPRENAGSVPGSHFRRENGARHPLPSPRRSE